MKSTLENPLGKTALFLCAGRALEAKKMKPLFVDPYGEPLAGSFGFEFLRAFAENLQMEGSIEEKIEFVVNQSSVRTAFMDLQLEKAINNERIDQVVILAVGGDCRSYRMNCLQGCTTFENDFPDVLEYRSAVLGSLGAKPKGKLISFSINLKDPLWPQKLVEANYDPKKKAIFLLEGLLMYFTPEERDVLLKEISELCLQGSVLIGDVLHPDFGKASSLKESKKVWTENSTGAVSFCAKPDELLGKFGFECKFYSLGDEEANFGRFEEGKQRHVNAHLVFSAFKK